MKSQIQNSKIERNIYLKEKALVEIKWQKIQFNSLNSKENIQKFQSSKFYKECVEEFINYWTSFQPKYPRRERPISNETAGSHVERISRIFGFYTELGIAQHFKVVFNPETVKSFFIRLVLLCFVIYILL